jgi:uroporphyrinogen decarboxylase
VRDEAAVAKLAVPDMDKLRYVFDAVTSIRKAFNGRVPLIGFSGSPWTLACYMVEGAGSDDYRLVKTMMYSRPDLMHRMLANQRRCGGAVPERPDRRRRAGRDGV